MPWHNLYFRSNEQPSIAAALTEVLQQHGYQPYDPFPGGSGTPIGVTTFVKLFVAPPVDCWVRVLGEPDLDCLGDLSTGRSVLHAWLTDTDSGIALYQDGSIDAQGLSAYLRSGKTENDLKRAQLGTIITVTKDSDIVPDAISQLARDHNVNAAQANKMMDRMTSTLFGKLDRSSSGEASAMQAQARALATGAGKTNWNSAAGQRLQALAGVIALPGNWRDPDFTDLREAYQAARMLKKNAKARLLPDEQAALNRLPNALDYEAVYMAKSSA
jgi:hypothetical protein